MRRSKKGILGMGLLLCLFVGGLSGQSLGLKVGFSSAVSRGEGSAWDLGAGRSWLGGLWARVPLGEDTRIQAELLWLGERSSGAEEGVSRTWSQRSWQIPVTLRFDLLRKPGLVLGLEGGGWLMWRRSFRLETRTGAQTLQEDWKGGTRPRTEGVCVGGYARLLGFEVGLRYSRGLRSWLVDASQGRLVFHAWRLTLSRSLL